jgi:hypothetical protein
VIDPLKILYLVVLETDDLEDVTPFQLFSMSWRSQHWALELLSTLPCDILEPSHKMPDRIAHRMGGMRALMWHPINMTALQQISVEDMGVFVVILTGEEACAKVAKNWIEAQSHPIMHVSTEKTYAACQIEEFSIEKLHDYCRTAFVAWPEAFRPEQLKVGGAALENWREVEPIASGLRAHGHNITHPNYMSLRRAGRTIEPGDRFISDKEGEYTRVILESAEAVLHIREEIGIRPVHFMALLRPSIVLAEPALVRPTYARMKPEGPFEDKTVAKTMRWIQTQKGLHSAMDGSYAADLLRSAEAKSLIALRQSELETFMLGVGLFAAQTTSCVVRLSPGVNHVFPNLSAYANNMRSPKLEARLKSRRLFDRIQENLAEAVGAERIAFIEKDGGPLKIVCDAPIEWLPVGNLPLGIRYDCSRLNATPGNLLMGLLTEPVTLTFTPKQLQKILVVSSFRDDDPLRNVLVSSLEAIRNQWEEKAEIIYKTAKNSAEFVEALNGFDGYILIFDGHGVGNADTLVGKIMIADEAVDVWSLRGFVHTPPIVILSACDTHGIDASSQATVGNAFLGIGARTVLATLLPVDGPASAAFIARLVYRIADFIPAVLSAKIRVLNWTEIISGLLRMLLASEILDALVGPPAPKGTPRARLQTIANVEINSREFGDWYERLLGAIAKYRGEEFETVRSKARNVLARSEAIRYVQLGNPETILIDDGEIRKQVLQEYNVAVS